MDLRLSQIKRAAAPVSEVACSGSTKKYKTSSLWPKVKLADSRERTATWSRAEKDHVLELLQMGLTSPLMIAKHMGMTKSLRQVAEFLEYLKVCSTLVGSDDDDDDDNDDGSSTDSESGDSEDSSESESESSTSELESETVPAANAARLSHRSRPASSESGSGSSGSSSESSSDSEVASRRMSVDSGGGYMSVESDSNSPAPDSDSDVESISSSSKLDTNGGSSSSADESEETSSESESDSSSESDGVSEASDDGQSIAKEETQSLAEARKCDKKTISFNRKMFKLFRHKYKGQLHHYWDSVLFDPEYGDVLAKLIHGDDKCTVDQATYSELLLAVIHFVQVVVRDAAARQSITRGTIHANANTPKRSDIFHCIYEALDSSGFPPRRPLNELYDGLLYKYLDEATYDLLCDEDTLEP
ncbi:hypothetical protein GGI10_000358 [Coemansia sp. RSA 2530]|nr:hypothetical protein GGI10_000358 [Coemansia sp. RSA 2530]